MASASAASVADGHSGLSTEAAQSHGHINVAGGKGKKEDKDKIKLTDLIDKTRATKEERDGDVAEVEGYLIAGQELASSEAGMYAELTLRHEDIGADNDQIFLIDGDSLLHEILMDPLIDWEHGGQFLHVLYALERYVQRFQEGGRVFRFVFFHAFGGVAFADAPLIQIIRETAIRHLRERLRVPVSQFHNWWEAPFHAFLERVDPAFILVGDGAGAAASASADNGVSALSAHMSSLSLSSSASSALPATDVIRSLSLYLLSHHFRVIRLTELSFANNSMYAFQMAMAQAYKKMLRGEEGKDGKAGGYKPHPKVAAQEAGPADDSVATVGIEAVAPAERAQGPPRYRVEAQKNFDAKLFEKLAATPALQADKRLQITTYALARLLAHPAAKQAATAAGISLSDLSKAVLAHTLLLRHLPVDSRCLVWEDAEARASGGVPKHQPLLQQLFAHLLEATVATAAPAAHVSAADAAAALDLFDGRLLSFLLQTVLKAGAGVKSFGWSAPMEQALLAAWEALRAEAKDAGLGAFLPFGSVTAIADAAVTELDEARLAEEARQKVAAAKAALAPAGTAAASPKDDASSAAASAAAAAPAAKKSDDDVVDSWEDEDTDDVPVPAAKAAAPAPAKKVEEEDDGGSWEDFSDEEPEEKKEAAAPAAAAAKPAASAAARDESKESGSLLPVARLQSQLVTTACATVESVLSSAGLLDVDAEEVSLSPYASAYKTIPGKVLEDGMDTEENKSKAPLTRREQRAASRAVNYWEQYAKSLVGGRLVLREVVVAAPSSNSIAEEGESDDEDDKKDDKKKGGKGKADKADKPKKAGKPGAGGGKGGKGKPGAKGAASGELSMKDKIKAQVEEAKRAKEVLKVQGKINVASNFKTLDARIAKLDSELEQIGDASAVPALLLLLDWCLEAWKIAKPKGEMEPAVKVFVLLHDIIRRFKQYLSADEFKKVALGFVQLGFEDAAHKLTKEFVASSEGRIAPESVRIDAKSSTFPSTLVGLSYNRFQLEYAGPWMLRNVDSAPDERVTKFYPDRWQRDLLDVADASQSALIVAPTSAGKTFISYYVMKNVLAHNKVVERSRDKGVVVYCAPNKALVNQVSADVYQRYGPVFGTATEDHQDKALTSEVLITVPSVLEKLLLNPQREGWVKQIKWVIFDEVHLISSAGEGSIWERCLSLIRCPFLALSATVGNPRGFYSWLFRLDALRNRKVHLIVHETRWSDLEKGMYLPADPSVPAHQPDSKFDMRTMKLLPTQFASVRVHPAAAIGPSDFADNAQFPKELSFSPRDSLSLYDALTKHANSPALTPELKKELASLSPDNFFSELLINKARAMEYEGCLKRALTGWLQAGLTAEVSAVMTALTGDLRERIGKMESKAAVGESCYDNEFIRRHFFSLLLELQARDQLPGIVFSNNDELCVKLVTDTLEKLEELEAKQLETESVSEETKLKIRAKQQTLKALKKNRDKVMKAKQAEEESRDADQIDLEIEAEADAYVVDPRFSFIEEHERMDRKELDYWVNRTLYKTQWKRSHPLIRALYRGLGVHHSGLVKQYRDLVETLFRGKHIKVVVATSTLALGVNMPARSVTLCGDSKLLTPLQYRQMSGRAGRRGYDAVGHVVFFAVPPRKMFRLLKSPLNSLRGHFPINTTLALKMVDYYALASDKKDAGKALLPLLKEPFFADTYTGKHLLPQIEYYFRYSLDLLHSKALINNLAQAYGLSTLATVMSAADPSNYGFVALLESGHLAKICKPFEQDKNRVARELLAVLSHLFFRVPAPAYVTKANFRPDSANAILLPPIDPEAKRIIGEYNTHTLERFTNFVKTFGKHELHKVPTAPEQQAAAGSSASATPAAGAAVPEGTPPAKVADGFYDLPVSGLSFPWTWSKSSVPSGSLMSALQGATRSFEARSPFVAVSGHGDSFGTARALADTARNGLFLDSKLVPLVMEDLDSRGQPLHLNAYVVDFYRSQHFYSLITDNRLSDAFAWGLLKNWSLLLSAITTALRTLSADEQNDLLVKSFDHLTTTFDHYFNAIITV